MECCIYVKGGIKVRSVNIRIEELELRSTGKHLLSENQPHRTMEIVRWGGQSCYAVAYFELNKDNRPSLRYVLDRPLQVPRNTFMDLVELGYHLFQLEVLDYVQQEES